MFYGTKPMQKPGEDTAYPAIIDTGSSQLSIPPDVFDRIQAQWAKDLPDLDCSSDSTFCQVPRNCAAVQGLIQSVGF
jgi:hypothetical protein